MLQLLLSMMALICYSPHAFAVFSDSVPPPTRLQIANALHWIDLSDEESQRFFDVSGKVLPETHPLHNRLQLWVDALYARLESRWPERFRDRSGSFLIPRPKVRLEVSTKPEAHVSAATVCYRINIKFEGKANPAKGPLSKVILINDKGSVGVFERSKVACVDRMDQVTRVEDVVELLGTVKCDVHTEGQTLVIGKDCKIPQDFAASDDGADGIMLRSMVREVTLTTGLFAIMPSEGALVYTLLHELAHYFRSHSLVQKSLFQYFYHRDGSTDQLSQPPRDERMAALGQRLQKLPQVRTQPIEGQTWHSEMFSYGRFLLTSLIEPACSPKESPCFQSCKPWISLMQDQGRMSLLGRFPQARLSGRSLEIYREWEHDLTQCLGTVSRDRVSLAEVRKVFWRADIPNAVGTDWRLIDAAKAMNQKMMADGNANDQVLTEALQAKLGYYTTEEEADNLALSWLGLVGLPASVAFDHWWAFAAFFDPTSLDSPLNFSLARCLQLYQAVPRWTEGGLPVQVPIGSFSDPHHSSCYRIWNLDQRQPYSQGPLEPLPVPHLDFGELKKLAQDAL